VYLLLLYTIVEFVKYTGKYHVNILFFIPVLFG
jgi:hypothetical protein